MHIAPRTQSKMALRTTRVLDIRRCASDTTYASNQEEARGGENNGKRGAITGAERVHQQTQRTKETPARAPTTNRCAPSPLPFPPRATTDQPSVCCHSSCPYHARRRAIIRAPSSLPSPKHATTDRPCTRHLPCRSASRATTPQPSSLNPRQRGARFG